MRAMCKLFFTIITSKKIKKKYKDKRQCLLLKVTFLGRRRNKQSRLFTTGCKILHRHRRPFWQTWKQQNYFDGKASISRETKTDILPQD